jgi:RNA polymerase sigma factor (sigma-70 family)
MANARSGMALGQIQRLFDEGSLTGLTDAQLVERFLNRRDEGAFAALVARHGSMVLAVCRGVLKDQSDAEDAFQATFLVLFRKAGGLTSAGSLGSWLYRVAYRIALRANAVAARRRERPIEEVAMAAEARSSGEGQLDREILPIIHAEIDRLPDRYRAPIALCYLQGLSYEQAAHQLGWPLGTVGSRIARARELLRSRLVRRGVTATTATLSVLLAREATAAPAGWVEAATRAAMRLSEGAGGAKAAGTVSAAVALSDQVLRRMLMIRLIQMTSILATAAMAGLSAWVSLADGGGPRAPAPANNAQSKRVEEPKNDGAGDGPIRGRVLTPDGQPVKGAAIYVGQSRAHWMIEPVARTDADGRFQLDPAALAQKYRKEPMRLDWKKLELTAFGPAGFGGGWSPVRHDGGEVELRLVPDDAPIRGRILDTQGRPISGVTIHVHGISDPPPGDLDALLRSGSIGEGPSRGGGYYDINWWIKDGSNWSRRTIKTGPDGRFQIDGAGRDRIVALGFEGPGIEHASLRAMTRLAPPSAKPRPGPTSASVHPRFFPLYGASFDHVAGPSKPIEGVVRLKGTGRPLAGVRVICNAGAAEGSVFAVTDEDGHFRLDGLPKVASYKVVAIPDPGKAYQQTSVTVADTDGLKPIPVTIDLPAAVILKGRLIDKSTGKPVAGHIVQYISLSSDKDHGVGTPAQLFGPEGFTMTVPRGPGLLQAQAEGKDLPYQRARLPEAVRRMGYGELGDNTPIHIIVSAYHTCRMIDVPADVETFTVDLELTRGGSRRGRVVDPDGRPVAGALVYGLSVEWEVKPLDDAGFDVIGLESGKPRTVSFMHKDRRLAGSVDLEPGDDPVDVRLQPCGSAVGRLVDPDGSPLAGAMVGVSLQNRRGEHIPLNIGLWPSGEFFTADQDGRFRVEGLNPDLVAHLGFRPRSEPGVFLIPESSKDAALKHLTVKPGETLDLGEIHLSRPPKG